MVLSDRKTQFDLMDYSLYIRPTGVPLYIRSIAVNVDPSMISCSPFLGSYSLVMFSSACQTLAHVDCFEDFVNLL
jgi:hypothetical protein